MIALILLAFVILGTIIAAIVGSLGVGLVLIDLYVCFLIIYGIVKVFV